MSLILTQAQAQAAYGAMCELNNVGAQVMKTTIVGKTHRVSVNFGAVVYVKAVSRTTRPAVITEEQHPTQAAFAQAYGLLQG